MNSSAAGSRIGLLSVFGSTLFQLSGVFMLSPLMLLMLKKAEVSTTVAGLFAATTWLGVLIVTPFASVITQRLGRRQTMWLASSMPLVAALGFFTTNTLWLWFVLELMAGIAGGLRWVLAEAFIAEFAPPRQMGRYIGIYATMVGMTFVIGPTLLAWAGTDSNTALWLVVTLLSLGLAWTALIPVLPPDHDQHTTRIGLHGLWQAVLAHPVIILGGTLLAIPSGMLADRFASPAQGRRLMMRAFTGLILLVTLASPFAVSHTALVWPLAFVWGAAGGALYTLSMTDIGASNKGLALINSTAVLVLTYTLGGLSASAACGALIDVSVGVGFPALMVSVAVVGLLALFKAKMASSAY
ncbi:MAG: major facilitator transporter [Comamonadaceae bacterium]|nr:MAG: major facilitator transporter [Comamonadaceae bacterium]